MAEKEYIVSLKRGVDASAFKAEMTQSSGDANIPARSVDVANERLLVFKSRGHVQSKRVLVRRLHRGYLL